MVEGGKQHSLQHARGGRLLHAAPFQIRIVDQAVFELHIHVQPRRCQQLQHLPERGNGGVGIRREGLVEAQGLELAQRHPGDEALAIRASVHRLVVRHHQIPVRRDVHVQLHAVGSLPDRQLKSFQRVFRRIPRSAAVRVDTLLHVRSFLSPLGPAPVAARSCSK